MAPRWKNLHGFLVLFLLDLNSSSWWLAVWLASMSLVLIFATLWLQPLTWKNGKFTQVCFCDPKLWVSRISIYFNIIFDMLHYCIMLQYVHMPRCRDVEICYTRCTKLSDGLLTAVRAVKDAAARRVEATKKTAELEDIFEQFEQFKFRTKDIERRQMKTHIWYMIHVYHMVPYKQ